VFANVGMMNNVLQFWTIYDNIMESDSDEEKCRLLFSVKQTCIEQGIEKPSWWYGTRNRTEWLNDDGSFIHGYDLGGF